MSKTIDFGKSSRKKESEKISETIEPSEPSEPKEKIASKEEFKIPEIPKKIITKTKYSLKRPREEKSPEEQIQKIQRQEQIQERKKAELEKAKEYKKLADQVMQKLPKYVIDSVDIALIDQDMIPKIAECLINDPKTTPGIGGTLSGTLSDPKMGPSNVEDPSSTTGKHSVCETCGGDYMSCPGHFGFIQLATPIYHPLYGKILASLLSCVCIGCGNLLIDHNKVKSLGLKGKELLSAIQDLSNDVKCKEGCLGIERKPCKNINFTWNTDYLQLTIENSDKHELKTDSTIQFNESSDIYCQPSTPGSFKRKKPEKKKKSKDNILFANIYSVKTFLDGLSKNQETLKLLGFDVEKGTNPRNFIMEYLIVMPPVARQAKILKDKIHEDNFTDKYKSIITKNNAINSSTITTNRYSLIKELYKEIEELIIGSSSEKDAKSIKNTLQSKSGIIRGNSLGKRVDYSARTVLGPGPEYRLGQIGIPRVFASQLRRRVLVCIYNIQFLQELMRQGKIYIVIPRSEINPDGSLSKFSGQTTLITDRNRNMKLQLGDTVERELMDGDYIIFNRHPTLHKQSMMGYQVILHDDLTIRLPLATAVAHNFDFDGDEGNLNMVFKFESIAELMTVMNVKNNILNAQNSRPLITPHFDTLTGVYLMTLDGSYIERDRLIQYLMKLNKIPDIVELQKRCERNGLTFMINTGTEYEPHYVIPGKVLFSSVLPSTFTYEHYGIIIRNGVLLKGPVSKTTIGGSHNSIIQAIYKQFDQGSMGIITSDFISDIVLITDQYIADHPYSMSLEDCFMTKEKELEKRQVVQDASVRAQAVSYALSEKTSNTFENERRENQIKISYNEIINSTGEAIKLLEPDNNFVTLLKSGGKGSSHNIVQITTAIGQLFDQGKRFRFTIDDETRCLPYFYPNDPNIKARGFCEESYLEGLDVTGLWFQQAAGRLQLMDTSVKIADIGDIHRKLTKILGDVCVNSDYTVRNKGGIVFQFFYSGDGMNALLLRQSREATGEKNVLMPYHIDEIVSKINAKYSV